MGKATNPRKGSMQYWPRKRARRPIARVRNFPLNKIAGFGGYKAGMTSVRYTDTYRNSLTKNDEIVCAATILECPPMKVYSIRFYKEENNINKVVHQIVSSDASKELKRKIPSRKKKDKPSFENVPDYDNIRLVVYTQPSLTGLGKKRPDLFEVPIGGGKDEQIELAKERIGKEIDISDVFKEGDVVDVHSVTKGKGFQGPVKRFGVGIHRPKKEKIKRGPGARSGGWCAQAHMMYRVATAGQTGYHQRMECNKQIIKISDKPEEVNPKGGIVRYGLVRGKYILLKGSVPGPKKRMIILSFCQREPKNKKQITPNHISLDSQQG